MESSHEAVDDIATELENANISRIEDHEGNINESALKIPTFDFTEKSWKTDFVLIVEGIRLYVNKAILALASPVFDTMFQSEFKESTCDELELPEKRLRDVVDFLRYIYPNDAAQITQDSALNILPIVEEYQVFYLKPRCEALLLENISEEISVEALFKILQVACLYNLMNLRKQCVKIACNKSQEDIDEAFGNNPPPPEASSEIFEQINKKLGDFLRQATESNVTLKTENSEQERQLIILKQYFSADVRNNKAISLEGDSNWRDITTVLHVDMKKKIINANRGIHIWDVPLTICISEEKCRKVDYLHISINCSDNNIQSKIKGRAIIVNGQPKGENAIIYFDGSILPGFVLFRPVSKELMKICSVKDISKGFLCGGHIGIIVQIYMSEPNRG